MPGFPLGGCPQYPLATLSQLHLTYVFSCGPLGVLESGLGSRLHGSGHVSQAATWSGP